MTALPESRGEGRAETGFREAARAHRDNDSAGSIGLADAILRGWQTVAPCGRVRFRDRGVVYGPGRSSQSPCGGGELL